MRLALHGFTDIGQRDENQDRMKTLVGDDGNECLLVVADGLGGHTGGSLAAETVVGVAELLWQQRDQYESSESFLRELVRRSHAEVNRVGQDSGLDPRSTLVALLIRGSAALSIHAGDSRVIQFDGDRFVKRTIDHSIGQLNVLRGLISEDQLATHPDQRKLFSHIGGEDRPDVEIDHWDCDKGKRFAVCSDGFWEVFSHAEIAALFDAADPGREMERSLTRKLARLDRHDNTTAVLAEVQASPTGVWYWVSLVCLALAGIAVLLVRPSDTTAGERLTSGTLLAAHATGPAGSEGDSSVESGDSRSPLGTGRNTASTSNLGRSEAASGSREGSDPDLPVAIERVEMRTDRGFGSGTSVPEATTAELREAGRIGDADELVAIGRPGQLAGRSLSRLRQVHKGIPVYGAEVVATATGGRIVYIRGHTAGGIDINPVPANDYAATVELASKAIKNEIQVLDGGTLVVMPVSEGRYLVAWQGSVVIDRGEEVAVFDPRTGAILLQVPVAVEAGDHG